MVCTKGGLFTTSVSETIDLPCLCISPLDIRSYDCLMCWRAHTGQVISVQFSVDETSVFSLGRDNQVSLVWFG